MRHFFLLMLFALFLPFPAQAQKVRYASPRGGGTTCSLANPCALTTALSKMAGGDSLYLRAGTYVLSEPINPPSGIINGSDTLRTFVGAYPGEEIIVSGLNLTVSGTWTDQGGIWRIPWQSAWTVPIPDAKRINVGEYAAYREQVVVGSDPLPYRYSASNSTSLEPGEIFVEDDDILHGSPSSLYIRLRGGGNPNSQTIRMSSLAGLFNVNNNPAGTASGERMHTKGITYRYGASEYGSGLLRTGTGSGGSATIIEYCTVEYGNSAGIKMNGPDNIIRRNTLRYNGKSNITSHQLATSIIEYNTAVHGNWKDYREQNAAGNKFGARNSIFRYNTFGPSAYDEDGIWLDVDAKHNTIYANRIDSVYRAGIFLEFGSDSNYVFSNVISRVRGHAANDSRMGINIKESAGNLVAYNTIWDSDGCVKFTVGQQRSGTNLFTADQQGVPQKTLGNLVINNACLDNAWNGLNQMNWDDNGNLLGREPLKSNKADGNGYWRGQTAYFRFKTKNFGTVTYDSDDEGFANWKLAHGFDASSFLISPGDLTITSVVDYEDGWRLPAGSQLIGRAIAIPDTSWWDVTVPLTDYLGNPRPNDGGDVGAHQYNPLRSSGPTRTRQTIWLQKGWNNVSMSVEPVDASLQALLADALSNIVLVKDQAGQIFSPEFNINTIGDWNPLEAYMIYTKGEVSSSIEGTVLDLEQIQIPLREGWNLIPYLRSDAVPIEEALASVLPDLMLVKDNIGRIYYPKFGIDEIGSMQQGQGYWVYVTKSTTLTYAGAEAAPSIASSPVHTGHPLPVGLK